MLFKTIDQPQTLMGLQQDTPRFGQHHHHTQQCTRLLLKWHDMRLRTPAGLHQQRLHLGQRDALLFQFNDAI